MVKISHCLGVFLVVMDTKFSIVSNSGLYGELTLRGRTLGKKDNWMLNEGVGRANLGRTDRWEMAESKTFQSPPPPVNIIFQISLNLVLDSFYLFLLRL